MLVKLAAIGALGAIGYHYFARRREMNEAFAPDEAGGPNFAQVRNAGAVSTATGAKAGWSDIDEELDQSFPASDPPANY